MIQSIPTNVLAHIVEYISLSDSCWALEATCSLLLHSREQIETKRDVVHALQPSCLKACEMLPPLALLRKLDLGHMATDDFVFAIESWSVQFPVLEHLSMVGSTQVSTLHMFHGHPTLSLVDITYCNKIDYMQAILLRESLPTITSVVRRIPTWLTGRIKTGFAGDGTKHLTLLFFCTLLTTPL